MNNETYRCGSWFGGLAVLLTEIGGLLLAIDMVQMARRDISSASRDIVSGLWDPSVSSGKLH